MIRTLSIVTIAAFLLSVVCLSIAISLAGPDLVMGGVWGWAPWSRHVTWNHTVTYDAPAVSRDLAWDGGDTLTVEMPANVHFTQAEGPPKMTIYGPREEIANVVVQDGHVRWSGGSFGSSRDLDVRLSAPKITHFTMDSSGDLEIRDFRQDQLVVRNNGSGDISASGAAKALDLTLNGSGDADFGGLASDGAKVTLAGSSDATISPKSWANLEVTGSGSVTLTTHPKQLQTRITGSGSVEHADGSGEDTDSGDQT